MQIQIRWLLQKPTDLDLHCLQRQGISGFSRTRVKYSKCNLGIQKYWYVVLLQYTGWFDLITGITLKVPSKIVINRWQSNCCSSLFYRENKTWHFIWKMYWTLWSQEMHLEVLNYLFIFMPYAYSWETSGAALAYRKLSLIFLLHLDNSHEMTSLIFSEKMIK